MAFIPRTWQVIQQQIISQVNTLIPTLTSTSKAAYWRLWTFIQAVSQNLMEQRFQLLQSELEATAAKAAPETESWVQAQVLNFQYGNVIQINPDFSISYPDPQQPLILNNCAVVSNGNGGITIKVTSDSGLLSTAQSNALTAYLDTILGGDINYSITNALPDILNIIGTVYYNGQYSGSIFDNVTTAINNYINSLGFNGILKLSDLIDVIRNAPGVTNFVPTTISAAPNAGTPLTYLVNLGVIQGQTATYQTISGQIQVANTLSSDLTFTIANN